MRIFAINGVIYFNDIHELVEGRQYIDNLTIDMRFDRCFYRISINGNKYWIIDNYPGYDQITINDDFTTDNEWVTNSYVIMRPDNLCEIRKQEKNVVFIYGDSNLIRIGDDPSFLDISGDAANITPGIINLDPHNPPIIFDPCGSTEIRIYRTNIMIGNVKMQTKQNIPYFINFKPLTVTTFPTNVQVTYNGKNLVYDDDPETIVGGSTQCLEEYMFIINDKYNIPNTSKCITGKKYYMNFGPSRLTDEPI